MDKQKIKKLGTYTALIFLLSWLLVNISLSFTTASDNTENQLKNAHNSLVKVEARISEVKPEVAKLTNELSELRANRSELQKLVDSIINKLEPAFRQSENSPTKSNYGESALIEKPPTDPTVAKSATVQTCTKTTAGEDQNKIIRYAYDISGNNKDFIFTLEAENGSFDINAINWNSNGSYDKGLCQLNSQYNLAFIQSEWFSDWRSQIDYCWKIYSSAEKKGKLKTMFYGYNKRFERSKGKYSCG